ncbi:bifunctional 5,10-methylenetetrahydrofolate dehydrogenase/5,10-methenyltetrahydrofolate cyclohydrolase [Candidatus Saccharibacteria bacterium CPR2]|nr:bifunctional 5,10-methylenetetrahydrofolate dehydrogenase/5,10-methenyltetrahydrofolate cyclohydrolase [Candidatus Saccharibacteria bacterium CPR2]
MKLLNGNELAGFIKERQAKQARFLRQSLKITPKLAIVQEKDDPVINTYVKLKQSYGEDIGVEVEIYKTTPETTLSIVKQLNGNKAVHGIIVQLPLVHEDQTEKILNCVIKSKDVDGLAKNSQFDPATPTAILWLLAGYNIDLAGKEIAIVGKGRLVGAPLIKMLQDSELKVLAHGRDTENLKEALQDADVVISATGTPNLIKPDMLKQKAIVIDAGTTSEKGKTVGDLSSEVYKKDDLTITPQKGGVGPLTVCALFENVLKATS